MASNSERQLNTSIKIKCHFSIHLRNICILVHIWNDVFISYSRMCQVKGRAFFVEQGRNYLRRLTI